ncbi:Calcium-gated potassium channel MthK [ANME-1 cluster archaeon GoMg2]|nr:Calcium-gated potassium channel MthK [ANME-1 cluster archaeon GoMg2]
MLIRLINKLRALRRHVDKFRILFILIFVILFGSIAFSYFEKKEIWDAVYWVIVTVTTVGYGDFYPETTGGRITFVLVALGGIGTIAYVIEQLVSFSTKSALKKLFGTGAVKMKQHTIIVGWNTKAEEAVKELKSVNEGFLVVGSELNHTELDAQEIPHISGDPTKSETLNRCGIGDAKTLMIPLENDSETIMIALATRKLNPGIKIVATCETREHVEMMRGAGIDHIISYAEISGRLLAHSVTEPVVVNFIMDATTSVEGFDLKQIKVGEKTRFADVSLGAGEKVIALYRGDRFVFDFAADVMLEEGDYLVVITSSR